MLNWSLASYIAQVTNRTSRAQTSSKGVTEEPETLRASQSQRLQVAPLQSQGAKTVRATDASAPAQASLDQARLIFASMPRSEEAIKAVMSRLPKKILCAGDMVSVVGLSESFAFRCLERCIIARAQLLLRPKPSLHESCLLPTMHCHDARANGLADTRIS